ncbi:MAG TPA: hypothetical protein VKV02_00400 [Acidobacteriaceae bacterium]|nr:hypothetical protein [Acidobacteriaceae bacterium]
MAVLAIVGVAVALSVARSKPSTSRNGLAALVNANLNRVRDGFTELGFHDVPGVSPSYSTDCTASATGEVKQFLIQHHCVKYAAVTLTARRQGVTAKVAISWVMMPTTSLAEQYQARTDQFGQGNPPGQALGFDGLCYASGPDGTTVWVEQIAPTGHRDVDREILQATAPGKLSSGYLQQHCVR